MWALSTHGEYSQTPNLKCVLHVTRTFPGGTELCWLPQQQVLWALWDVPGGAGQV